MAIDAVVACEISALATFQTAQKLGITTILDAPSIQHRAQDALHGTNDPPALHRRLGRVKDREVELADAVFTVSSLARSTYVDVGVPPEKVHALPLGADLSLFKPADPGPRRRSRVVFVFVGATIRRKGFDLLLQAFDTMAASEPDAELRIIGPLLEQADLLERPRRGVVAVGPLSQPDVAAELEAADCLVLPSRNDSYAMVVPEALACGTPVLISNMVGARDLVVEGRNGWVVPVGDVAALTARMRWCVQNREALAAMRPACRESALEATWAAYHRRLIDAVTTVVSAAQSGRQPKRASRHASTPLAP
jgi:glycosyltransferase involved in cell wall biosynthesis